MYNLKITEFENGLVEIKKYDKVVNGHLMYITQDEVIERQRRGKEMRAYADECDWSEIVYNPFTELDERLWDLGYEDIKKARRLRSQNVSRSRTINAIYNYSRQCNWEYFITLTYSNECVDRYDLKECMSKARKWFNNQRSRYASDLQYLFVPEMHKDGAYHIHGLVARVGNMLFADSGHKNKNKIVYNLSGWRFGFSTATKVNDVLKVSTYITKYITKELCESTLGMRRYYRSRNIPEPQTTEILIENDDDFVGTLCNSLGKEVSYEKTVKGYVNVNYKYLM